MDLRGLAQQVKASYSELEGSKFKPYWAFSQALETNVFHKFDHQELLSYQNTNKQQTSLWLSIIITVKRFSLCNEKQITSFPPK